LPRIYWAAGNPSAPVTLPVRRIEIGRDMTMPMQTVRGAIVAPWRAPVGRAIVFSRAVSGASAASRWAGLAGGCELRPDHRPQRRRATISPRHPSTRAARDQIRHLADSARAVALLIQRYGDDEKGLALDAAQRLQQAQPRLASAASGGTATDAGGAAPTEGEQVRRRRPAAPFATMSTASSAS